MERDTADITPAGVESAPNTYAGCV